jgi:hypothetical protein
MATIKHNVFVWRSFATRDSRRSLTMWSSSSEPSRYQAVMDAFIAGTDVPDAELRKAWQDTTNATPIWHTPIYEEFFRALRAPARVQRGGV